jgi:glycosyltransferase involved in cell wall biosynthesis
MLTSEFPPDLGGISVYIYNLSKRLIERGHKVTVITRGTWGKTYYENIDGIFVYRVRFIPFYPNPFKLHGLFVNKLFKRIEPELDLLHVHGSISPVIGTHLPTVVTVHGTVARDIDNMPVKSFHFLIVKFMRKQILNAEKAILESADVITAVSQSCVKELKEYHTISKEIIVVNNGVDTNFFIPGKNKKKGGLNYILYTGRLETRKGLIDFIKSAKYVCQESADIKFILTGKGTIKNYLERRINNFHLKKNFYFAGFVDRGTLLEYYQNATIYVLPSYYEGLPTTLLEAMSCGIASIATDVEGSSEVITDGETGLLVPPRDPEKLAEAMLKLLDDEELRKRIVGANARRHIVSNYDWEIITDRIEEAYKLALHTGVR